MNKKIVLSLAMLLVSFKTAWADDPNGLFFKPIPAKTVVLTFDDACQSHATIVGPILKEYGFGGTFFVTGGFTNRNWYMSWEQIKSLEGMGLEVGSHTTGHGYMAYGSSTETLGSVLALDGLCRSNGISKPTTLGWPLYSVNWKFLNNLYNAGYRFARGGHERAYRPTEDSPFDVPSFTIHDSAGTNRFRDALQQATTGQVVVFCFHGVPDGEHPTVGLKPETFKIMMQYLKDNHYTVLCMRDLGRFVGRVKAAITNTPSTGHTSRSAVLHATFSCDGLENHVYACWGLTNGGSNALLWANSALVGKWTSLASSNLSYKVKGLENNTHYYFTFCASNEWGRVWASSVQAFSIGKPAVNNRGASNPAPGVTQLDGELLNGEADVYVYWGPNDGGTRKAKWGNVTVLKHVDPGQFSGRIDTRTNLFGVTYYYRCYAENSFGAAWSPASACFTTMKPTMPPPVVVNNSFEMPIVKSGTWAGVSAPGWSNVVIDSATSGFVVPRFKPDGNQAVMIGGSEVISQSLNFAKPGDYTVSFYAIGRYGSKSMNVRIDGADVLALKAVQIPGDTWTDTWPCFTSSVFHASAGAHTLSFAGHAGVTEGGSDEIDFVQINGAGVLITIANAAAQINADNVVLHATLECPQAVYDVYAFWGTENGGTNAARWAKSEPVGQWINVKSTNISYKVKGLKVNTPYFFTFRAMNKADDLWAPNVMSLNQPGR